MIISRRFQPLWNKQIYSIGNLYTWGTISLGSGIDQVVQPDQLKPRKVEVFNNNISKVFTGNYHTAVITDDGNLYTFGSNKHGQLGLGHTREERSPQLVDYFYEKGLSVIDVALGGRHSLALASDGKVYSWGFGGGGRSYFIIPQFKVSPLGQYYKSHQLFPNEIPTINQKVKFLAAGLDYSHVVLENNELYSFGNNRSGELGNGEHTYFVNPFKNELIQSFVKKGISIQKIQSSDWSTLILFSNGQAYGWGKNGYGQIGVREQEYVITDRTNRSPMIVNTKYFKDGEKIIDFELGSSVSLFLTDQNRVYKTGLDELFVPHQVEIPAGEKVTKIAASRNSYAIRTDKNFYATGSFIEGGYDLYNKGYNVFDEKQLFKGQIEQLGGIYSVRYAVVKE